MRAGRHNRRFQETRGRTGWHFSREGPPCKLSLSLSANPSTQIVLKKWYSTFKDHITLADYEIGHGSSLEMYYS